MCFCCYCSVASVVSDSVRPHRQQPTRLPRRWDSPGKNTGVGCHFLLQGMKVKSESEITQSCPTLSNPMDYSLPGSSVHGIFQARVLEWGAIAFYSNKSKIKPFVLFSRALYWTPWIKQFFYMKVFLFYFIIFWPCHAACKTLVPQPRVEPGPPLVEAQSLNHWPSREFPIQMFLS